MPVIKKARLYDRLHEDGPRLVNYAEDVYLPGEECPHETIPWWEATLPGQWVRLDDGGATRAIRITKVGKIGTVVTTVCGGSNRDRHEKEPLVSTGEYDSSRASLFTYKKFTMLDGRAVPEKLVHFVDWMLRTGDPVLAVRITHPMRRKYLAVEEQFPAIVERQRRRDQGRVTDLMRREDVRWILSRSIRKEMEDVGLTPGLMISTLKTILEDKGSSAETRRKTALDLLDLWRESEEKKGSGDTEVGESRGAKISLVGNRGEIRRIRAGRTDLRENQQDLPPTGTEE